MSPIVSNLGNFSARVYGWSRASGGWRAVTLSGGQTFTGATVDAAGTFRAQYGIGALAITSAGAVTWQKSISGGTGGKVGSGGYDTSGNFYAIYTVSSNNSCVKFDSTGAINWQGYPNAATNVLTQATYPSSGNQYFGFNAVSVTTSYFTKANSAGTYSWSRSISGGGGTWINGMCVTVDSSENFYAAMDIMQSNPGYIHGIWVGKYNSAGTIQWQQSIGIGTGRSPGITGNSNGAIASDGTNCYVVHRAYTTANDNVLAKFNSTGTNLWQRSMIGSVSVSFSNMVADSSGNTYVLLSDASANGYILKYNTSGTLQWQRSLSGLTNIGSMTMDTAGTFLYVAGGNAVIRLATDGTGTGTIYTGVTYAVSTVVTDSAYTSFTWGTASFTDASNAGSMTTSTLTSANTTYTLTVQA